MDAEDAATRRRSGRVSKKPEVLAPTFNARGTRAEQNGSDTEMVDGASDEEDDGEESGEASADEGEGQKRQRSRKRRSASKSIAPSKRQKVNGTAAKSAGLAIRPAKSTSAATKRTKRPAKVAGGKIEGAAEDDGLFGQVFAGDESHEAIADSWGAILDQHESGALKDLVNFTLKCCGCDVKIDEQDIEDPDNATSRLEDVQDQFQAAKLSEYPLIAKKTSQIMRRSLTSFINQIIRFLAESGKLISHKEILDNFLIWVGGLSSAASRPLRHTATLISLEVTSALCRLANKESENAAKFSRQAEGEERNKKPNKKRKENFQSQADAAEKQTQELDVLVTDWFNIVFIHRYRDVDSRIRVDCVVYLGDWVMIYPRKFLESSYVRYLGWDMSDPVAATRQEVIRQLSRIYKDTNKHAAMRQFTDRFRPRMVEIACKDVEVPVRLAALELVFRLRGFELLEPNDLDDLCRLIFDSDGRVRKESAKFLSLSVLETIDLKEEEFGQENLNELFPDKDTSQTEFHFMWFKFKSMAELLDAYNPDQDSRKPIEIFSGSTREILNAASGSESRLTTAAEVVLQQTPELSDWKELIEFLLYDFSSTDDAQDDSSAESQFKELVKMSSTEERILLDVLHASIKIDFFSLSEETKTAKSKTSSKEIQKAKEKQDRFSQKLAVQIPKLLKRFNADTQATCAILRAVLLLNLDVFQELRQESSMFSALLEDINRQFLNHEDPAVMEAATAALAYSRAFDTLEEITDEKLHVLWEDTIDGFAAISKDQELRARGSMDQPSLRSLSTAALRLSKLSQTSDPIQFLEKPRTVQVHAPGGRGRTSKNVNILSFLSDVVHRGVHTSAASWQDASVSNREDDLVEHAINTLICYCMWYVVALNKTEDRASVTKEQDRTFCALVGQFAAALLKVIEAGRRPSRPNTAAASAFLDMKALFSRLPGLQANEKSNARHVISVLTSSSRIDLHQQKVLAQVFTALEKQYAKAAKIGLDGPDEDEDPEEDSDLSDLEPEDEDPESDEDLDDADHEQTALEVSQRRRQARAEKKQRTVLLAEEQLCEFACHIVRCLVADSFESDKNGSIPIKKRFLRNRVKLGKNYKACVAEYERADLAKQATKNGNTGKPNRQAKDTGSNARATKQAKSAEQVVESDEDMNDAIEDSGDEAEQEERAVQEVEDNDEDAQEGLETAAGMEDEPESVAGD